MRDSPCFGDFFVFVPCCVWSACQSLSVFFFHPFHSRSVQRRVFPVSGQCLGFVCLWFLPRSGTSWVSFFLSFFPHSQFLALPLFLVLSFSLHTERLSLCTLTESFHASLLVGCLCTTWVLKWKPKSRRGACQVWEEENRDPNRNVSGRVSLSPPPFLLLLLSFSLSLIRTPLHSSLPLLFLLPPVPLLFLLLFLLLLLLYPHSFDFFVLGIE